MSKKDLLPLDIAQITSALFLAVCCFLGAPNDALLSGIFWAVTAVKLGAEVIQRVQNR